MYWAARHERKRDRKGLRDRLGLTRKGLEAVARAHIEASGWMADHLTKATGLHVADENLADRGSASVRRQVGSPAQATPDRFVVGLRA